MPALSLLTALSTLGIAAAASHPYTASVLAPVLSTAENQKGFQTYSVQSSLDDQFTSVQHCLPIQLTLKEATNAAGIGPISAIVDVNTTSLQGSYTIHPFVQNKQLVRCTAPSLPRASKDVSLTSNGGTGSSAFGPTYQASSITPQGRLSLNGTVESRDLINVTITVPPRWAIDLFNATNTGKGYLNISLPNASSSSFQLQLSGAGIANVGMNLASIAVNADTNGSFIGNGRIDQAVLNWASSGSATLNNTNDVTVQKSGSGGIYISGVNGSTLISQTGKGVTAVKSTKTASVVQSGPGAVFLGVASAAKITYAGGKNTSYIQGTGESVNGTSNAVAAVQYTTTGNGTLVFSASPGAAYPAISVNGDELKSCLNVSNWSNKACNETAVPIIPIGPTPAASRPKCAGTWVLTDSDVCYTNPSQGYQCETVKPATAGEKVALVVVLLVTAAALIWVNTL